MSTVLVDPQARPSGSAKKFSTVRYGFGRSFIGVAADCARIVQPENAAAATTKATTTTCARGATGIHTPCGANLIRCPHRSVMIKRGRSSCITPVVHHSKEEFVNKQADHR